MADTPDPNANAAGSPADGDPTPAAPGAASATAAEAERNEAAELLAAEEGLLRQPGPLEHWVVPFLAVAWSCFQLSIATVWTLNSMLIRSVHLGFAMLICYLSYPALKRVRWPIPFWQPAWLDRWRGTWSHQVWSRFLGWFAARDRIPWIDWVLGIAGSLAALYIVIDYQGYLDGQGQVRPGGWDLWVSIVLILLLLEGTRRTIGPALAIVVGVFTLYVFFAPHMPAFLAARAVSVNRYVSQMTRTGEGIYGVPLDVSASVVYLFVLFGSMLERAGGGRFFIDLAMSLLGGYRGGPAKAAVLSSGLTGMISGSSIANIVTTGTFTIPLMKEVGYPAKKAAAIEVASSTDGQLAPPVMGAAAFIISEKLGIEYRAVVKAAIVPAAASYAALFFITHVEACKLGLKGLPASRLPVFFTVLRNGLHFLFPLGVLLWMLIGEGKSAEYSAAWGIGAMAIVMLLQHTLRGAGWAGVWAGFKRGVVDLFASLAMGGRNMVGVALATAASGIIVGVVNLGLGAKLSEIITHMSGGNFLPMLLITALGCLVIGMGLPTTATYIVMSALLAPVILEVAGANGLVVPALAAHLFVFYFGILADDTPPVGLAAYAAAAIAKSPPIATGLQGFLYDIRTAILPFAFVYNSDLILDGVNRWDQGILILVMTCMATFSFAGATQGWLHRRNRWWETGVLLVATFALLRPDALANYAAALLGSPATADAATATDAAGAAATAAAPLFHSGGHYPYYLIGFTLFAALYIWQYLTTPKERGGADGPAAGGGDGSGSRPGEPASEPTATLVGAPPSGTTLASA